jgi:dodecin
MGRKTVLVVDDDAPTRRAYVALLVDAGFRVLEASNGGEAIFLVRTFGPDVVLMDVVMPVVGGVEAAESLREYPDTAQHLNPAVPYSGSQRLPTTEPVGDEYSWEWTGHFPLRTVIGGIGAAEAEYPGDWLNQCIHPGRERNAMSSIVKVVEVIAQSETSFDDAVEQALKEASQTIENIKEIWVSGQKAIVENNRIVEYRVTTKISFLVKGHG